jgi:protein phosphatase
MTDNDDTQQIVLPPHQPLLHQVPVLNKTASEYFTLYSASATNVGCVRRINEDACLELPDKKIWAIADGMGGHDAGDVASSMVVDYLNKTEYRTALSKYVDNVEDAILAANSSLYQMGQQTGKIAGTTIISMLFHKKHCLFMWAGDSRAYLSRNGDGRRVTRDHSYVEELIERGELNRVDAENHPKANVITRAIGASPTLFLDMDILEIAHDDMFLLCSDGLFKEVIEPEIYAAMNTLSPDLAVHELMKLAIDRGAKDNVTIIAIKVQANG